MWQQHPIKALAVGAALLAAVLVPGSASAQQSGNPQGARMIERTVSVSATGSVTADPDQASISTGVQTEGDTAREALSRNNVAMGKLIDGLKALGIGPKDIQTTGLNVNPRYQNFRDGRPPVINGYQALNQVRILVRDLKRLGEILDQSVTLGANQMGGIAFDVSQAETLKDDARKVAMANALRRATLYATAAGAEIGPVLNIAESVQMAGPRPMMMGRAAMAAEASVPVEPGSQRLEVQVHVTYGLK
jgi:uncharacterized protein